MYIGGFRGFLQPVVSTLLYQKIASLLLHDLHLRADKIIGVWHVRQTRLKSDPVESSWSNSVDISLSETLAFFLCTTLPEDGQLNRLARESIPIKKEQFKLLYSGIRKSTKVVNFSNVHDFHLFTTNLPFRNTRLPLLHRLKDNP